MRFRFRWPLWSLMASIVIAAFLLLVIKSYWPGWSERFSEWQKSRPVYGQLKRSVTLKYPAGIPLKQLLPALKQATRSPEFPSGIPVFIDAQGIQDSGATINTPIVIDVENTALGDALKSSLKACGLGYMVRDGMLTITRIDESP